MQSTLSPKHYLATLRKRSQLLCTLALVCGLTACKSETPVKLQQLGPAPAFEFDLAFGASERADGKFATEDLRGKIWLVNFFFSSCKGPCPMLMAQMKAFQDAFADSEKFRIVSITVDPDTDTPQVLRDYAEKLGARQNSWIFLRASSEMVSSLLNQGLKLGSLDNPQFHTTRVVLIDEQQTIRGYFQAREEDAMTTLKKALSELLTQPQ